MGRKFSFVPSSEKACSLASRSSPQRSSLRSGILPHPPPHHAHPTSSLSSLSPSSSHVPSLPPSIFDESSFDSNHLMLPPRSSTPRPHSPFFPQAAAISPSAEETPLVENTTSSSTEAEPISSDVPFSFNGASQQLQQQQQHLQTVLALITEIHNRGRQRRQNQWNHDSSNPYINDADPLESSANESNDELHLNTNPPLWPDSIDATIDRIQNAARMARDSILRLESSSASSNAQNDDPQSSSHYNASLQRIQRISSVLRQHIQVLHTSYSQQRISNSSQQQNVPSSLSLLTPSSTSNATSATVRSSPTSLSALSSSYARARQQASLRGPSNSPLMTATNPPQPFFHVSSPVISPSHQNRSDSPVSSSPPHIISRDRIDEQRTATLAANMEARIASRRHRPSFVTSISRESNSSSRRDLQPNNYYRDFDSSATSTSSHTSVPLTSTTSSSLSTNANDNSPRTSRTSIRRRMPLDGLLGVGVGIAAGDENREESAEDKFETDANGDIIVGHAKVPELVGR